MRTSPVTTEWSVCFYMRPITLCVRYVRLGYVRCLCAASSCENHVRCHQKGEKMRALMHER